MGSIDASYYRTSEFEKQGRSLCNLAVYPASTDACAVVCHAGTDIKLLVCRRDYVQNQGYPEIVNAP